MNWEVRTMRSGTSCFNGTLYRKTMARFWPLWALYGLFWMFAIPLNLMNRYFNYLRWTGGTGTPQDLLLDLAQSIPEYLAPGVWLAALMGLLCAMACFGYLYNNRSACMMHALPMRRETLFVTQYLAGLSFLLLPVAAVALCGVLVELALLPPSMWADALVWPCGFWPTAAPACSSSPSPPSVPCSPGTFWPCPSFMGCSTAWPWASTP